MFYGARAIGWTLFILSVLMILGVDLRDAVTGEKVISPGIHSRGSAV